jgi:hypothetical protein
VPGDHRVATSRDAQPERLCGPACSNVTDDSYTRTRVSEAKLGAERPTGGSIALWIFGHEAAERADSAENVRPLTVTVTHVRGSRQPAQASEAHAKATGPTVSSAAAGARRTSCRGGCISQREGLLVRLAGRPAGAAAASNLDSCSSRVSPVCALDRRGAAQPRACCCALARALGP